MAPMATPDIPIFAELTRDELAAVSALAEEVEFPAGYPLMIEGIPATEMAVVISGAAAVRKGNQTVAMLGPGDVVGEIALIARRRRTASVVTTEESTLWVLEADAFDQVLADHPSVGSKVLRVVAERLAELEEQG